MTEFMKEAAWAACLFALAVGQECAQLHRQQRGDDVDGKDSGGKTRESSAAKRLKSALRQFVSNDTT